MIRHHPKLRLEGSAVRLRGEHTQKGVHARLHEQRAFTPVFTNKRAFTPAFNIMNPVSVRLGIHGRRPREDFALAQGQTAQGDPPAEIRLQPETQEDG
jgi:hypothetical protein